MNGNVLIYGWMKISQCSANTKESLNLKGSECFMENEWFINITADH